MDLKILEEIKPEFSCNCSREKVEKALISIGEKDLREIYEDGKNEELKCHFCNKKYVFTPEEIGRLLALSLIHILIQMDGLLIQKLMFLMGLSN